DIKDILIILILRLPETNLTDSTSRTVTQEDTQPTQPSLSLLEQKQQQVALSEEAAVGYGVCLARTPTIYQGPRGTHHSYLPPPRCRARYRWTWHQVRKHRRPRRARIPRS
ncbi:E4 protein, partial [Giraffa camelopardalis papillomavirus 1]